MNAGRVMVKRLVVLAALVLGAFSWISFAAAEEVVIEYLDIADVRRQAAAEIWVPDFEAKNPGIRVDYRVLIGGGAARWDLLKTMTATGDHPDVHYWFSYISSTFMEDGMVLPLNSFIERDGLDLSQFRAPGAEFNRSRDGIHYALPTFFVGPTVVQYRTGVWDEFGLAYPTTDFNSLEWTWDDFKASALRLTRDTSGDGVPDRVGFADLLQGFQGGEFQAAMLHSPWVDAEGKRWLWGDADVLAEVAQVTDEWAELIARRAVYDPSWASTPVADLWRSGNLGMHIRRPWQDFSNEPGTRFAPMPRYQDRDRALLVPLGHFADGPSISAHSEHPEAAWQLLKYLATDPLVHEVYWSATLGALPAQRDLQIKFLENPSPIVFSEDANVRDLFDWVASAPAPLPQWPFSSAIRTSITQGLAEVSAGRQPARIALEQISSSVQSVIDQFWLHRDQ